MEPGAFIGAVQEVTSTPSTIDAETSPSPEIMTHADFDALPQNAKIKWLVPNFAFTTLPYCNATPTSGKKSFEYYCSFLMSFPLGVTGKPIQFPMPSL